MRTLLLVIYLSFHFVSCNSSKNDEEKFFTAEQNDESVLPDSVVMNNQSELSKVSAKQLSQLLSLDKAYLIDCRKAEDFQVNRIPNALFFDISDSKGNEEKIRKMNLNFTFYVYGSNDQDSEKLGEWLIKKGASNLYVLDGGFQAWEKANLPTNQ